MISKLNAVDWDQWFVSLITLSLIVVGITEIVKGDWQSLLITTIVGVIVWLPVLLPEKFNIKLPKVFIIATIGFLYATLFLGEFGNFYEKFWWWDILLHSVSAFGLGLLGVILILIFFRRRSVNASPRMLAIFAFTFALSIGAVWEIIEYILDSIMGWNMQKSGLDDTMLDLMIDTLGAMVAAMVGYLYLRVRKKKGLFGDIDRAVRDNA